MIKKVLSLQNHAGFRRYFKNSTWLMGEQGLRIIVSLLVGIWVARYLGPEQFGIFNYVLAFTAIFGCIAKLGLDDIMVRELVNQNEQRDVYLGTAFCLKVIGAFIAMGLLAAAMPFTSNDATTQLYIFIIAAGLFFQSFDVVGFYFQSQVLANIISICKIIQLALSSLIKIYLVLTQADLLWFVVVTLVDAVTLAVSYMVAYRLQKNPSFYRKFDFSIAKQLFRDSWPLIFSSIVIMIYMRIDQIMIKEMLDEYDVGIYSAAVRLSEAFYFIPTLITVSVFPAILNAKKISQNFYLTRLQRLYTLMIWLAIIIALLMTLLSEWLVTLLYGEAYQAAGQVLMIHIWASVFVFIGVVSGKWYVIENHQRLMLINTSIGAIVNIFLNYIGIKYIGINGVAYATLISYAIAAYFMDFIWTKTRENFFNISKSFLRIG